MSNAIGLDIGHSSVKIAFDKKFAIFPAAVRPASVIIDYDEAQKCKLETIHVGNKSYFIGETALLQGAGSANSGLSENWIETNEHIALMLGGMRKAKELGAKEDMLVVMGLPANLYGRQRDKLKEIAQFQLKTDVHIISQPSGPFNEHILNQDGILTSAAFLLSIVSK